MSTTQTNTKEFTTKSGIKVVAKPYLTFKENSELVKIYLDEKKDKFEGYMEADEKAIKMLLISIDDHKAPEENLWDVFCELPAADAGEIKEQFIADILSPKA